MVTSAKQRSLTPTARALFWALGVTALTALSPACGVASYVDQEPVSDSSGGAAPAPMRFHAMGDLDLRGRKGAGGDASGGSDGTGGQAVTVGVGSGGGSGCSGNLALCLGICIDLDLDPTNCGQCGKTCGPLQVCLAGSCEDL